MSREPSTDAPPRSRPTARLAPDGVGLTEAARLLRAGRLVAFPTETVYGLGADGRDAHAVAALYAAKGRPAFNPLIAHVEDADRARAEGVFEPLAAALARAFWPGPLTLVVPLAATAATCDLARAGLDTIALRVPAHPVALDLLRRVAGPVVAPSANRSGRVSPTAPAHVIDDLDGRIDAVVDGGPASVGLESTIVACLGGRWRLLRPGGVPRAAIEAVAGLGFACEAQEDSRLLAPGGLASHYAPRAAIRLGALTVEPGEAALLFGGARPAGLDDAAEALDLSPSGDLAEAAANLFGHLRRLDRTGAGSIAVTVVPEHGLGEAINDRLKRAAAPR